ncbi:hypothetical protein [Hymenobacter jejuensis]|uniref:Uncharacterized protein n=1 Tax=Hymenobacter jejuensis TaxID=2502781 RepID=A0A5B7ZY55_9BACT|nr:hypothetical protein [Hymenobacter jejuensis]QDA60124.1 hypothetical protein FHG12_08385 [Hymenobacter jejuensis]
MSIFGSDRHSGTMGGLLSGLFGGRSAGNVASGSVDSATRNSSGIGRKLVSGALLAAGAAYLYNRSKNRNASAPTFDPNR